MIAVARRPLISRIKDARLGYAARRLAGDRRDAITAVCGTAIDPYTHVGRWQALVARLVAALIGCARG
jgi:hypothetical protein